MHRFLIVDDNDIFCMILAKSLQRRGYEVLAVNNAAAALNAVHEWQPDGCVLDLKIGQDSGLHLLPDLLKLKPTLKVVMLTGYASIATAVGAVKQGAVNYLTKPADAEDIIAAFSGEGGATPEDVQETPRMSVERLEWEHIQKVLAEHHGNISETARVLGMHRRTLQRKLYKYPVKK